MAELFYVFDLGDALAVPLARVFRPVVARIIAQLISFGVNTALWAGFAAAVAAAIQAVG